MFNVSESTIPNVKITGYAFCMLYETYINWILIFIVDFNPQIVDINYHKFNSNKFVYLN